MNLDVMQQIHSNSNLSLCIADAAVEAAIQHSASLLEGQVPKSWLEEICAKVRSIARNEIIPPVVGRCPQSPKKIETVISSVGQFLGIVYLGDYALEEGKNFDVAAASLEVARISRTCGMDPEVARYLLSDLRSYYIAERERQFAGTLASLLQRYILKSTDVFFAQLLALFGLGVNYTRSEFGILRAACIALEILDDASDIEEDAGRAGGNPFVIIGRANDVGKSLFDLLVQRCMPKLTSANSLQSESFALRAYCCEAIRRVNIVRCKVYSTDAVFARV